ncbi:MAG: mechanosensitive ion channel [Verrucomicrobiota bacterium]|nr:mechanosensitive ion channel [Verrucomicrobiota bacterium]
MLLWSLLLLYRLFLRPLLSADVNICLDRTFFALFVAAGAHTLQRALSRALRWRARNVARKTKTQFDDEFIPLLKRVAHTAVWLSASIVILKKFDVNLSALIAALGVTSLAIALAAQDTIANIIAGLLIMLDKPFRVSDEIKLPSGERVRVLGIGARRSRFLNLDDGSIVIVPNLDLSKSKLTNYTYGKEHGQQS